jgi:hypothetical protein
MSNRRDRRRPPSQRRNRESRESVTFRGEMEAPALDLDALARICSPGGAARVDGALVPILIPHADPADPSQFDAAVCDAGVGRFVRPRFAGDGLDHLIGASTAHMLIRELTPGIRARVPIEFFPDGMLN